MRTNDRPHAAGPGVPPGRFPIVAFCHDLDILLSLPVHGDRAPW
ncbi:hypothetical protein KPATCC21470_5143 [Kitasatospora purpeofusca]